MSLQLLAQCIEKTPSFRRCTQDQFQLMGGQMQQMAAQMKQMQAQLMAQQQQIAALQARLNGGAQNVTGAGGMPPVIAPASCYQPSMAHAMAGVTGIRYS